MNYSTQTIQLIRISLLTVLLTSLSSANAQAVASDQHTGSPYVYQLDADSHWKVAGARITPNNDGAQFAAKLFHRHKRATYPTADVQVRILDSTGKLLGSARATPDQIFNAEKAWRKTGVSYRAQLDFVPPPGSRVELEVVKPSP